MKVLLSKDQGVSLGTGTQVNVTLSKSIRDHMLNCSHVVAWEDFYTTGRDSNHYY